MKPQQEKDIIRHGEQLNAIFNTGLAPLALCKKLRRIETAASALLDECNTGTNHHVELCAILTKLKKVLFKNNANIELYKAVFINGDPKGYALKIDDKYVREHNLKIATDWGCYGLIAPEIL